jgi:hypothetical protein
MKRRVARISLAILGSVAALSGGAARAATDDLDEVMHLLAARHHGQVSFVEQHFLSLLKRPAESSGELIYDAPNRLEKRTLEPRPESLVLVGDVLTVERGNHSRVLDLKSYPQVWPFIESIRATLAGDRGALERAFRLDFSGSAARWTLILVPTDAQVAKNVARVQIDGAGNDLQRVEIRQTDGDRSLMILRAHVAP